MLDKLYIVDQNFKWLSRYEGKVYTAGFIAINIIILPVWIAIGTPDLAAIISLLAISVSLPMLAVDLLFTQMQPHTYSNKYYLTVERTIKFTGWRFTIFGLVAAIWHISWIVALTFAFVGLICYSAYFSAWRNMTRVEKEAEQTP